MKRESIFYKLLVMIALSWSVTAFGEYEWIDEQISNDFASYETGISKEQLDMTMELGKRYDDLHHRYKEKRLIRVKVIKGVLYIFNNKGKRINNSAISYHLQKVMEIKDLPDLDFIYCNYCASEYEDGTPFPGPIFSANKKEGVTNVVFFHDRLTSAKGGIYSWNKASIEVEQSVKEIPWKKKNDELTWHGRITDIELDCVDASPSVDDSKRVRLSLLAREYPMLMDVGIIGCKYTDGERAKLGIPVSSPKTIKYQMGSKYQIVLDGLTCTNPGFAWRLLSNCTCLKEDSPVSQWFYSGLTEGLHYLPIKSDLSNLVETIEMLRVNDELAQNVAEAGREWAKKNLADETLLIEYCAKVLKKYASLQKFEPALLPEERRQYFPDQEYVKLEKVLSFDEHSGFFAESAEALSFLVDKFSCKTAVDLGSCFGESTRHIARCLPEDGVVFAVDLWKGSKGHHAPLGKDEARGIPKPYRQFLSNCIHSDLTHKIIPKRLSTLEAARNLCVQPDLVYVDASNDEELVYQDLKAWYPRLKSMGILCGSDWSTDARHPVRRAVKRFAKERGLFIETHGRQFWMLKKTPQKILLFNK